MSGFQGFPMLRKELAVSAEVVCIAISLLKTCQTWKDLLAAMCSFPSVTPDLQKELLELSIKNPRSSSTLNSSTLNPKF